MSSFKAKAAQVEKKKGTRSTKKVEQETPSTTETELALDEQTENIVTESVPESILTTDVAETTDELYGEEQENEQSKPKWERMIPLDRIRPNPHQPRKTFDTDKLNELAEGMRGHGWIGGGLPVRAYAPEPNTYELVWGERRWRAAALAGLKAIPCVVSTYSDEDMIEKGLLENIQREDLSNLEEGQAYVNLLTLRTEQGKPRYSIRRLATRIGKDKSYIEDRLKYARVPVDIQQLAVDQPDISPRIIHELGELAKMLKPEERAPVVEGVREGNLRIEDVREIRKDVEQQVKNEAAISDPSLATQLVEQETPASSTTPQVAVATDTLSSLLQQEEHTKEVDQEPLTPVAHVPFQENIPVAAIPVSPLAEAVIVSVLERTLKRDNEAIERIFQRISSALGLSSLNSGEKRVLRHFLTRWNENIHEFMSQLESEPEEEQ